MDWCKMSEKQKIRKMEMKRNGRLQYRIDHPLPIPEPINHPMFTMEDIVKIEAQMILHRFTIDNGKKVQRDKDKKKYCKKYKIRNAKRKMLRNKIDPIYHKKICDKRKRTQERLTDSIMKKLMGTKDLSIFPKELIEAKKTQIRLYRVLKELKE